MQFKATTRRKPYRLARFISVASATVVEIMGRSGFELICIDAEHAPFSAADIEHLIPRRRLASTSRSSSGVSSIGSGDRAGARLRRRWRACPDGDTAGAARAVVDAVRAYPPVGSRASGIGRAAAFGLEFGAYLASANDDLAAIVQIETRSAVENVEEIVAVPGIDMIFVGPGELLGLPRRRHRVRRAHRGDRAGRAGRPRTAGVPLGMFCLTPDAGAAVGCARRDALPSSGDLGVLASGSRQLADAGQQASGNA